MAPKTTTKPVAPPKPIARKRFTSPTIEEPVRDILESGSSDDEMQIAPAKKSQEPEWEGFGEEEGNEEDEEDEGLDADTDEEEDVAEKDDSEEELERLVFGDSAGFREGVKSFAFTPSRGHKGDESQDDDGEEEGIEAVDDNDLFFFDSGPAGVPAASLIVPKDRAEESDEDKPVWDDSDDDRIVVSLASVPQLRKLRETEADDVVGGKEYVRRLRKQYQRLYPTPDWALKATGKTKRKRTGYEEDGDSEEEEGSDMDVDGENELSTQPLARLLRDADIVSRVKVGGAKRRQLQSGTINIHKLRDVSGPGPSAITSLSFHPSYPLLLSSGPASTLYLHHVNRDSRNPHPLLTSLHIKKTPLTTTAFHPSPDDSRIFLSARRRYFHIWNIATGSIEKVSRVYGHQHEQRTMEDFSLSPNGKYMALRGSSKKGSGVINILDATTLQWTAQARIESRGGVAAFVWWGDGNGMSIAGKSGEVTEWSVRDGVIGRWMDDGAVGTTNLAVGGRSKRDTWLGGDRWIAVGSSSGIVNIYDRRAWIEEAQFAHTNGATAPEDTNNGIPRNPKPFRTLPHLTTPTSHLAFSPDGQILAMASRWKQNALKLVHMPSGTVFKNWPTRETALGRISAIAWGRPAEEDEIEGSLALLAVGAETGRVRMWDVKA